MIDYHVCPDDAEAIACSLLELCDAEQADVIFTLGGTGLRPHEMTPDATERVSERLVPGIAEAIRDCCGGSKHEHVLSRATAGIRGQTLIINLPGGRSARWRRSEPSLTILRSQSTISAAAYRLKRNLKDPATKPEVEIKC